MFADPFIVDVEGLSEDLQLEIINLQSNNDLRSKHRELSALQFYHTLPSNISRMFVPLRCERLVYSAVLIFANNSFPE